MQPLYCGLQEVLSMIGPKTKVVSLVHVSNTLGSILPTAAIVAAAHKVSNCPTFLLILTTCAVCVHNCTVLRACCV